MFSLDLVVRVLRLEEMMDMFTENVETCDITNLEEGDEDGVSRYWQGADPHVSSPVEESRGGQSLVRPWQRLSTFSHSRRFPASAERDEDLDIKRSIKRVEALCVVEVV